MTDKFPNGRLRRPIWNLHRFKKYIIEGYHFFRDFALDDDANSYALEYDLDDFNSDDSQTDIRVIIREFEKWLQTSPVQMAFLERQN